VQPPGAPSQDLTRADLDLEAKGAIEDATRKAMQSFVALSRVLSQKED